MKKSSPIGRLIDKISGIFLPVVGLLSAAGILKGLLAALLATHVLTESGDTYLILNAMADALFYFLPMVLAVTAAKKIGTNPFTAMVIGGILMYPTLTGAFEAGTSLTFAGLPVRAVTYHSSVIPIILAVLLLKYVERLGDRIFPEVLKGFLTPLCGILICGLATLAVFGPAGKVAGDALAGGYRYVYALSPVIAGAILGAVIQPMVIFGFHWSLVLVSMNNLALHGSDTILAFMAPAAFAQAGAALAVFLRSKSKNFKSLCVSAAFSAGIGGVTEPAMFGVNLPLKVPMAAVCIAGSIGGALVGLTGASAKAFAFPALVTLPVYIGKGFPAFLICCAIGFLAAFLITLFARLDERLLNRDSNAVDRSENDPQKVEGETVLPEVDDKQVGNSTVS